MGVGFIVYMVVLFVLKDDIFMFIKHLRNNFEDL